MRERCEFAVASGKRVVAMQHRRTLLGRTELGKAAGEHLHFLLRLLVALRFGRDNAALIGPQRLVDLFLGAQRLAEKFPCGRIRRIEIDGTAQVRYRGGGVTCAQVFMAQRETQQRAVLARSKELFKALRSVQASALGQVQMDL